MFSNVFELLIVCICYVVLNFFVLIEVDVCFLSIDSEKEVEELLWCHLFSMKLEKVLGKCLFTFYLVS